MDRIKILSTISTAVFLTLVVLLSACSGPKIPNFDGKHAFEHIETQCAFGPRTPNSPAHDQCREYLLRTLQEAAPICRIQQFIHIDTLKKDTLHLTNLIASFNPKHKTRILLCAHWDCRPWADKEPDTTLHRLPVPGANDGASGVAVLLVMADIMKSNVPPIGVDIVFFDGEDYGRDDYPEGWLLGSRYFVQNIGGYRPAAVILLDMIGDSDLQIYREYYSNNHARWLVDKFWTAAKIEGAGHFFDEVRHTVLDDHVPFLQAGIPAIDVIDMDYPFWHTLADTPDKCSESSLGEVGRTLVRFVYDSKIGIK